MTSHSQSPLYASDRELQCISMRPEPVAMIVDTKLSNLSGIYPYTPHSSSIHPRQQLPSQRFATESPALSISSPQTLASNRKSSASRKKRKRLFDIDRKAICAYHRENPTAIQQDIALRFGVDRSTISRVLQQPTKWLNSLGEKGVEEPTSAKFPELEEQMLKWLESTQTRLTYKVLQVKAKALARDLHIPEDKFNASAGWLANFKKRHGLRGRNWTIDGKNFHAACALTGPDESDHLQPHDQQQQMASSPSAPAGSSKNLMHEITHQESPGVDHSFHQEVRMPWSAVRDGCRTDSPKPGDLGSDSTPVNPLAEGYRWHERLHHEPFTAVQQHFSVIQRPVGHWMEQENQDIILDDYFEEGGTAIAETSLDHPFFSYYSD